MQRKNIRDHAYRRHDQSRYRPIDADPAANDLDENELRSTHAAYVKHGHSRADIGYITQRRTSVGPYWMKRLYLWMVVTVCEWRGLTLRVSGDRDFQYLSLRIVNRFAIVDRHHC